LWCSSSTTTKSTGWGGSTKQCIIISLSPLPTEPFTLPARNEQYDSDNEDKANVHPIEGVSHGESEAQTGVEKAESKGDGPDKELVGFYQGWETGLVASVAAVVEETYCGLGEDGDKND
jgi:hypothetical protein